MTEICNLNDEEKEFYLWEKMRAMDLSDIHKLLESSEELIRFTAAKEIQIRGKLESYEIACALCKSIDAKNREIGAFILGQLGTPVFPFKEGSISQLVNLLKSDVSGLVRATAVTGIAHLGGVNCFNDIANCVNDTVAEVRACSAMAMGIINDKRYLPYLLLLSKDENEDVRNWAVFGLKQLNFDAAEVRDRFVEMLKDESVEIRGEVIVALAKWRDIRVFDSLAHALNSTEVFIDMIDAAGDLGDKRLLPRLRELESEWHDDVPGVLINAISTLEKL